MYGWQLCVFDHTGELIFRSDPMPGPSRGTLMARFIEIFSEERPEAVRMTLEKAEIR